MLPFEFRNGKLLTERLKNKSDFTRCELLHSGTRSTTKTTTRTAVQKIPRYTIHEKIRTVFALQKYNLYYKYSFARMSPAAMAAASKKRKLGDGGQKYYAVRAGNVPGVYTSWDDCKANTYGYRGAQCKFLPHVESLFQVPSPSLDNYLLLALI